MKKFLGGLFIFLLSSHALAVSLSHSVNLNAVQEWQLSNPFPDSIPVPAQDKKHTIVVHVNKNLKSKNSLVSDTIELICNDSHVFFKAGATGSCDLPMDVAASFWIRSSDFHNGSEGTIIFVG